MTANIIDAATIAALAFQGAGYVPKEAITAEIIDQVEVIYILPVIGHRLAERLSKGDYPELFEQLALPMALYVKQYLNHPNDPATPKNLAAARTYMRAVSHYLYNNAAKYKEYNPSHDVLYRRMIEGGIVL